VTGFTREAVGSLYQNGETPTECIDQTIWSGQYWDMKMINVYEAKTQLSRLLREVAAGEDVVIAKDGKPLARLVPYQEGGEKRELGFARGRVILAPDFDARLPNSLLEAFGAGSS